MSISSMFSAGPGSAAGAAVAARTDSILDGRPDANPVAALEELAASLPSLDDIREVPDGDNSALTDIEREQKNKTEGVIRTAVAAGNTAVWVIAQGLERAAKGKWWRGTTHGTYEEYVKELTGRSASYARRLRSAAPLALETAARTGRVPNPGQADETRKVEKQHGTEAAILLFDVVAEITEEMGGEPTAQVLRATRQELPPALPDVPEQQRAEIETSARRALGSGVRIRTPLFEGDSNDGVRIRTPEVEVESVDRVQPDEQTSEEEVVDAEIVPDSIVTLNDALRVLTALNKAVSKDTFARAAEEGDPQEYADLRAKILKKSNAFQRKVQFAPVTYGTAPHCTLCEAATVPIPVNQGMGAGTYWWCEACEKTAGAREPLK
ncbi:hypothetical protein ACN6AT_37700 (plasmid) [Streptomyces sp. JL4002]|uniref:hypothetical protein n=1 Tax=Streptomyces sp. JL4002 TaxID=3404781 RepID=UPI003B28857C